MWLESSSPSPARFGSQVIIIDATGRRGHATAYWVLRFSPNRRQNNDFHLSQGLKVEPSSLCSPLSSRWRTHTHTHGGSYRRSCTSTGGRECLHWLSCSSTRALLSSNTRSASTWCLDMQTRQSAISGHHTHTRTHTHRHAHTRTHTHTHTRTHTYS